MALDDVAAELYALPPGEFTGARNAKAKEARQAGDKDLAAAITALGKPTMVGWLANQLVRERPDEMHALLDLGESLREATASLAGDQLKELSRQQRQVVYALVQQARGLANAAGHPASEDTARGLEETLHAALADPAAAEQLAAGRLTGVLSRSGFPGDTSAASAAPKRTAAKASKAPPSKEDEDAARDQAERDERQARQAAEASAAERDEAAQALDEATEALEDATAHTEDLKRQLEEAGEAQVQAQRRLRSARETAERAERMARRTAQRLADAEERTRRLSR